ncbi:MAG: cobyrinate a,c-diamide synthase [Elusimicrobia bacterium]|nr:cobyrinate a,c-diamide synthase [Elusimicrobiota bacterium]
MNPASASPPRILIAGTHSGVGKTTVTLGLIDGFNGRGQVVQPYKVGPDYIDPSLHTALAGRPSRNLDSFLCKEETLREIFLHGAPGATLCVIEGVMGFFDGYSGVDERGSSAHAARLLKCPVVLVLDAWGFARSAAAMVLGYQRYDPRVHLAGVFLNRVANMAHLQWVTDAIHRATGVPVLGYLFHDQVLRLPERHLGLVPSQERRLPGPWLRALRGQLSSQVRWNDLLRAAQSAPSLGCIKPTLYSSHLHLDSYPSRVRIGVAQDCAFSFYYPDNLEILEAYGAEILPFRPTEERCLPDGIQGLYFGGGFPEVYAQALSKNTPLQAEIRRAAQSGLPIYAECGGLMYLGESLRDFGGRSWPMAGVFPWNTVMERSLKLAYVHGQAVRDNLLLTRGETFRGHVFHFSRLKLKRRVPHTTSLANGLRHEGRQLQEPDGWQMRRSLAGYVHLHFASKPSVVQRWLSQCSRRTIHPKEESQ